MPDPDALLREKQKREYEEAQLADQLKEIERREAKARDQMAA